ncbi:hypothetical protein T11_14841 [Trichinella zimbabwensis]|uniref:Uncharacterized protein n=1 Tax=Trichinella zimbabwensis TaxID=268475 RepID=A0A0V1GFR0_9BILA|nr:hypothetical protein T11_14841 [Trichinella zimbabwensis]
MERIVLSCLQEQLRSWPDTEIFDIYVLQEP